MTVRLFHVAVDELNSIADGLGQICGYGGFAGSALAARYRNDHPSVPLLSAGLSPPSAKGSSKA